MANYMYIYKGEATDMADMTPDQGAEVLSKWERWIGSIGPALVSVGHPFGAGGSVVDDGSEGQLLSLSGYSVVAAGTLEEAKSLAEGHPFLSEGSGDFAIEVFELADAPF